VPDARTNRPDDATQALGRRARSRRVHRSTAARRLKVGDLPRLGAKLRRLSGNTPEAKCESHRGQVRKLHSSQARAS
jgi:hypothetical protein